MKAQQILALAGAFQAAALVQQLAHGKTVDEDAQRAGLGSIFKIDAIDVADVFGGSADLRLGLDTLVAQLAEPSANMEMTRTVFTMMQLERKLARQPAVSKKLQEGIRMADRQRQHFDLLHATISASLGELYEQTVSGMRPRIMVNGDPHLLQDNARVARIRANLLAGIRATVLWHQLGGRKWHLLLRRKPITGLARGMLARLKLEYGE